jgi:tetratricopeptide (TPR) repeat protein
VKLSPAERARLERSEEVSPEAIDAYVRGEEAKTLSEQQGGGLRKAIACFEEAVDRSPNYALAYAQIGCTYFLQSFGWGQSLTSAEAAAKARQALHKALEIDDNLADAHVLLAEIHRSLDYNWHAAEEGFRRGLALNPNDSHARVAYGHFLRDMGRFDDATREMTLARRLDPNSPMMRLLTSPLQDTDRLIPVLQDLLQTDLAAFHVLHVRLGEAYLKKGLHREALDALQRAREKSDDNFTLAILGHAYAVTGKTREARRTLDELIERSKQRPVSSDHFAIIYVGLGEQENAIKALERAYDERAPALGALQWEPLWDPLRTHPGFQALLKKMNFPQ